LHRGRVGRFRATAHQGVNSGETTHDEHVRAMDRLESRDADSRVRGRLPEVYRGMWICRVGGSRCGDRPISSGNKRSFTACFAQLVRPAGWPIG
jgi:hypothetical protein